MKRIAYATFCTFILLVSCKDDEKVFEKSSAQRSAEAIAALKAELVANPWKVKYQPVDETGSFWVLMNFDENGKVNIKSDLDADDGDYLDQTLTYRIDNSLGLELIIENYSFFSFLFELDDASFGAEYEFIYANKTPQGELVFTSKTDVDNPTILLFELADENDDELLGAELASNITLLAEDLDRFSSSNKLTYVNKDVTLFLSLDPLRRTASIGSGARKSNPANAELLNFNSGYLIQGDSLIFDTPFSDNVTGINIKITGIKFNTLSDAQISGICVDPVAIHSYSGVTSSNDAVVLEPTITDATGTGFIGESTFLYGLPQNMFRQGTNLYYDVIADIEGVTSIQLYWDEDFFALGFATTNSQGERSFALKHFTPTVVGNQITFDFEGDYTIYEGANEADLAKMDYYLDAITQGNTTFMYKYADGIYELNNPCSGFSYVFFAQ
jgi:hypothetical protein